VTDSHPTIGRAVLQKWGFEAVVCEAVAHQDDRRRTSKRAADLTDVLIASVALAEVCGDGHKDVARCAGISSIERLGLGPSDLTAIVHHTEHTLEALRNSLGC
jgi:HD-like signal output (HDOD) protein